MMTEKRKKKKRERDREIVLVREGWIEIYLYVERLRDKESETIR